MKKLILFLLFSLSQLFLAKPALAQSLSLSLTPSVFEATIAPGKSVSQVFSVKNSGLAPITLIARVVPMSPKDDTGQPNLKPAQNPAWLSYFSLRNADLNLNEPFLLSGNETRQLILDLDTPYNLAPTDLYATLLVGTVVSPDNGGNVSLGAAIGSNLLITVSPSSHPPTLVKIEDFVPLASDYLFQYAGVYIADNLSPIRFSALARNVGKYLTKTEGKMMVLKDNDPIFAEVLLPLNLLANSSRMLEASPSGALVFKPKLTTFGQFKIDLDIRSDNSNSHSEISLVLLPLKLIIGIIICLIILIFISQTFHRVSNQRRDRR